MGLGVEVAPCRPALRPGAPRHGVYMDPAHLGEVDHQPAITDRVTGDIVPAALHRHQEVVLPREAHRRNHVGVPVLNVGSGGAGVAK